MRTLKRALLLLMWPFMMAALLLMILIVTTLMPGPTDRRYGIWRMRRRCTCRERQHDEETQR